MGGEVREFRVWREDGDLMAHAEIHHRPNGWWTVIPYPFHLDEASRLKGSRSESDAEQYAASLAERWASEARDACPCGTSGAEGECGVINEHGISVQDTASYL